MQLYEHTPVGRRTRRGGFGSRALALLPLLSLVAIVAAGCLDEPPVEDRWNSVEMLSHNIADETVLPPGSTQPIEVRARVTFREILTGFLVAELRVSQSLEYDNVLLDIDQRRIGTSLDVNRILENSSTAGRATRAVTGYPQLMQTVEFQFDANVPASVDPVQDPPGGAPQSLYLVVYMGDGDEVELEDGSDSLVVTPFHTQDEQVLFQGIAIPLQAPAPLPAPAP